MKRYEPPLFPRPVQQVRYLLEHRADGRYLGVWAISDRRYLKSEDVEWYGPLTYTELVDVMLATYDDWTFVEVV